TSSSAPLRYFFFILIPHPLNSTLFPYTTLFRSYEICVCRADRGDARIASHSGEVGHASRVDGGSRDLIRANVANTVKIRQCHSRSEEHTSELQSRGHLVCRLLLEKKKRRTIKRK